MHTLPLGGLIWYNNTTEIVYDETIDSLAKGLFVASLALNLIEIIVYYIYKVTGKNLELQTKGSPPKTVPRMKKSTVKLLGVCNVLICVICIALGTHLFDEKNCLDRWFVAEDVLCKDCVVYYGEECLACNTTQC